MLLTPGWVPQGGCGPQVGYLRVVVDPPGGTYQREPNTSKSDPSASNSYSQRFRPIHASIPVLVNRKVLESEKKTVINVAELRLTGLQALLNTPNPGKRETAEPDPVEVQTASYGSTKCSSDTSYVNRAATVRVTVSGAAVMARVPG